MKIFIISLSLISFSAFAGSPKCQKEVKAAGEAMAKINQPKAKIQSAKTRAILLQSDTSNADTIGLTSHQYNVIVGGAKNSTYDITVDEEMGSCDVNKVLRSLDNSVG